MIYIGKGLKATLYEEHETSDILDVFEKYHQGEVTKENADYFISGVLKDKKRSNDNLLEKDVIALDLDSLPTSTTINNFFEIATNTLKFDFVLYPSFNNNRPKEGVTCPRFRLILPLIEAISKEESYILEHVANHISVMLGVDHDPTDTTWSQHQGLPIDKEQTKINRIGQKLDARMLYRLTKGNIYHLPVSEEPQRKNIIQRFGNIPEEVSDDILYNYIDKYKNNKLQDGTFYLGAITSIAMHTVKGDITEENAIKYARALGIDGSTQDGKLWADENEKALKTRIRRGRSDFSIFKTTQDFWTIFYAHDKYQEVMAGTQQNTGEAIKRIPSANNDEKVAKALRAKNLVLANCEDLYFTSNEEVFIKVNFGESSEIVSILSTQFKRWLIFTFESTEGGMLTDADIRTVISSIESHATFIGKKRDVYLRIAEVDSKIYIDLCNEKNQVLEINEHGFKVLEESPVLFRRTNDMGELPVPVTRNKRDYQLLGNYLNFSKIEDLDMITSYLLASFRPIMPKPILNLTGEAGTGKSMNTRLIRSLIDPAKQKDLLKKEIKMSELPLAAYSQYLLAFDNLSGISKEGSDLLCVVSTGGVMTTRKLYSDLDEIIVDLKKTVILNGIDEITKRQDLVSRTIFIETPKLTQAQKKTEADIWKGFKEDLPFIFGSLVHAVSVGLKNKGNDKTAYARMQDFGRFISDCSEGLGWEEGYWQEIYPKNQQTGIEQSIDSDPFASGIIYMMERNKRDGIPVWQGTSTDLINRASEGLSSDDTIYNRAWPKTNQVKSRLRRIAPLLENKGITWSDTRSNGKNLIILSVD